MTDTHEDLAARVQLLEDRLALIELEGAYARAFDAQDGDTWAALFTADGVYQSRVLGDEVPQTYVAGTEELRRFCRDAPFTGIHFLHLPQLTLAGDHARSRVHLEFVGIYPAEGNEVRMTGYYDVAYRRVGGQWRIERRVTTTFARTNLARPGYVPGSGLDR